jgi:pimeloyl-ACP methyl ester carboxylesterase
MPPSSSEEKKNDVAPTAATKPAPNPKAVPDYVREQSMANEINGTLTNGEIVTLSDGTQSFMGILTPAEHPRGAVIILPGCGLPPDGENVTHPLRTGLAAKGWTTLSLQMPVLAKEAKYYDYVPLFANADKRIDAGIALLKQKGIAPVVLAAHDCGAHMAMNWLGNKGDGEIAAYVGLGMGATDAGQEMVQPLPLDKMKIPVLDIYGEKDTPQVISLAPERQALLQKGGNTHSKQMVLPEADHDFKNKGDALSAVVATWLNSLPL